MTRQAEIWLDRLQAAEKTKQDYACGIRCFLVYVGSKKLKELRLETLLEYRQYLYERYSVATAQMYLISAKRYVGYLAEQGKLKKDFTKAVRGYKVSEYHSREALTVAEAKHLLQSIDAKNAIGKRNKALVALMMTSGLRCIEVSRADIGDIIEYGEQKFLRVQGKGRSDKCEVVEIPSGVYKLIEEYQSARSLPRKAKTLPLFASWGRGSGRLLTTSISRLVKSLLKQSGIDKPQITAHSLRHTCANIMIENGVELRKVQEVLRHRNITVTQRYLHEATRRTNGGEKICASVLGI